MKCKKRQGIEDKENESCSYYHCLHLALLKLLFMLPNVFLAHLKRSLLGHLCLRYTGVC